MLALGICPLPFTSEAVGSLAGVPLAGGFGRGAFGGLVKKAFGEPCSWLGAGVRWELLSMSPCLGGTLLLTTLGPPPPSVVLEGGGTCLLRVASYPLDIFFLSLLQTH